MATNNRMLNFALTLAAKLDPAFTKAFTSATNNIGKMTDAINVAQKHKNDLDRVMAQSRATLEAAQNFAKLKERLSVLGAQMKSSKGANKALSDEYFRTQKAVKQASATLDRQKQTLASLKAECGATGKSLNQLTKEQQNLEIASKRAQQRAKFSQLEESVGSKRSSFGAQFAIGAGQAMMLKGIASSFSAPIKLGMEFDKTMSRVGAISNASATDLKRLRDSARELGASTVFSASQAAEGMTYLAMSGFKTDEMLKAMPGMLSLASAGQVDLATSSDISASMLRGFGLEADQINRVADVMVNTFSNTSTDLVGLGETMKYVAPVASSLGVDIETVAAMAGKLGDNAIRGSSAGTALRSVFTRLVAPATNGAKALYALGVSVKDAQGNVRSMPEVLKDLGTALNKVPQAARTAMLSDIFGQEAMSAASILMNNAVDGSLQKMIDKTKEVGSAQRVATKQTNNLSGDLATLNSAWEECYLIISDNLTPSIRLASQWLTNIIVAVGNFAKENSRLISILSTVGMVIGGIIGSIAAFNLIVGGSGYIIMSAVGGFLKLIQIIQFAKTAFLAFRSVMLVVNAVMIANPIGLIITAIGALIAVGVLLYKNWDTIKAKAIALWNTFANKFPAIAKVIGMVWDSVKLSFSNLISFIGGIITFITNVFTGNWRGAWEQVKNIFANVFNSLVDVAKMPLNALISLVNSVFSKIGALSIDVPDWVPGIGGSQYKFEMPQIPALAEGGIATKPTLALIGEGTENEAVLPLSKLNSLISPSSSSVVNNSSSYVNNNNSNAPVQITFAPVINVSVADDRAKDPYAQIKQALSEGQREFERKIKGYFAQRSRLSYE